MIRTCRPLGWVGHSHKDYCDFPEPVKAEVGYALYLAQVGEKSVKAKPLKGFTGAGVLEVIQDYGGDTYRTVYTVRFEEAVYVLHAFQKKAKHGIATPPKEIDLVQMRLKRAEQFHAEWLLNRGSK